MIRVVFESSYIFLKHGHQSVKFMSNTNQQTKEDVIPLLRVLEASQKTPNLH